MAGETYITRQGAFGLMTALLLVLGLSGALISRSPTRSLPNVHTAVDSSYYTIASEQVVDRQGRTGQDYNTATKSTAATEKHARISEAFKNVRLARRVFSAAKEAYKKAVRRAKMKGATPSDKKAARRARIAVRKAARKLRASLARLRTLQGKSVPKVKKGPTVGTKKQIIAARKAVRAATAVLISRRKAYKVASRKAKRKDATPYDKKAAVRAARAFRAAAKKRRSALKRLRALLRRATVKTSASKKNGKGLKIRGKKLPKTCYCKQLTVGESKCYYFTRGKYCKSRTCNASYVCTGKRKSGGTMCLLRHVMFKVVPVRKAQNICRRLSVNSYMYVPYSKY